MILGFTGTRSGMTKEQREMFAWRLIDMSPTLIVHGDCIGADADAHALSLSAGVPIHIRPCNYPKMRAYCMGAIEIYPVRDPLDRNRDIVNHCDVLIATPWSHEEQLRSGTWHTVRYARKQGRQVHIIGPDGLVRIENASILESINT